MSCFLHCFTNTMLFLVFFNENCLHFLCIFIDLLVILDISLIYSAFFAIKNNNNFIFYQIFRVCIGEALCKRVCIKVKRSVCVVSMEMRVVNFVFQ